MTSDALALVDYSEKTSNTNSYNPVSNSQSKITRTPRAQSSAGSSSNWDILPSHLEFNLGYTANKSFFTDENINLVNFNVKAAFSYGVFIDLGMKGAQSLETGEFEQANSDVKIGLNWLDIGNDYNKLIVDLYGGLKFSGKSEISTQRSDRYLGATSEKRFGAVALGLGYERVFTENINDAQELTIGDISHVKFDLGIMVSNEIQFLLTYGEVKISASDILTANGLASDIKYTYLTPQMFLRMTRNVRLNLGAGFQVSRPDTTGLDGSLKVWDYPVVYGNSLFAGLNVAI